MTKNKRLIEYIFVFSSNDLNGPTKILVGPRLDRVGPAVKCDVP